jgi:hypothetical protein
MDAQPRLRALDLASTDVPLDPGVYAWYRRGRAAYVGKADCLRDRAWKNHMGQSATMGTSAFRRNVAKALGFGSSADIKAKRVRLAPDELAAVRAWILACSVAWVACPTKAAAVSLEARMKAEWMPPLTKR